MARSPRAWANIVIYVSEHSRSLEFLSDFQLTIKMTKIKLIWIKVNLVTLKKNFNWLQNKKSKYKINDCDLKWLADWSFSTSIIIIFVQRGGCTQTLTQFVSLSEGGGFFFSFFEDLHLSKPEGCDILAPDPSKPSPIQSGPTGDLSSGLLSCLLNTCKKYYRARLPEHGTWPFQVSEPTSNKPTKTIQRGLLSGRIEVQPLTDWQLQ